PAADATMSRARGGARAPRCAPVPRSRCSTTGSSRSRRPCWSPFGHLHELAPWTRRQRHVGGPPAVVSRLVLGRIASLGARLVVEERGQLVVLGGEARALVELPLQA